MIVKVFREGYYVQVIFELRPGGVKAVSQVKKRGKAFWIDGMVHVGCWKNSKSPKCHK